MKKLRNSLPKSWKAKVTTIEEFKYPHTLPLDKLIMSFLTQEMKLKYEHEPTKNVGVTQINHPRGREM